jgi:hypothetical protein
MLAGASAHNISLLMQHDCPQGVPQVTRMSDVQHFLAGTDHCAPAAAPAAAAVNVLLPTLLLQHTRCCRTPAAAAAAVLLSLMPLI